MSSPSSGFKPTTSGSSSGVLGNRTNQLNRREATILYETWAKPYNAPVLVDSDPIIRSPAKLKLLAAEALRREHFVAEFAECGGLKTFGKESKFNAAVLRAIAEQPFFGFVARINTWLRSTPRAPYPALPEVPRRGNEWSVNELVRNHPYYTPSPDRSGNPAGNDTDSSIDISPVKKIAH